jgi:hypothetical protein
MAQPASFLQADYALWAKECRQLEYLKNNDMSAPPLIIVH